MAPTAEQVKAAEAMKAEGNVLFSRQRFNAAADRYTEAITLNPSAAVFYVNRGMCFKKLQAWSRVEEDAAAALRLDADSLKAHYLMGLALRQKAAPAVDAAGSAGERGSRHEPGRWGVPKATADASAGKANEGKAAEGERGPFTSWMEEAMSHLSKALDAAREKDDAIKDEIWRELARTKHTAWRMASTARAAEAAALLGRAHAALAAAAAQQAASATNPEVVDAAWQRSEQDAAALSAVFAAAAAADRVAEVPSAFTCPLTMEVFRDPAITPSGNTYERAALLDHLSKVGAWDPVTRAPMTAADVRPNVALRAAVHHFLEHHPWAWAECY